METNNRQIRGLEIAATKKLKQRGHLWIVPSQKLGTAGSYIVDPRKEDCTCPDHKERGIKCKHIYAVEFSVQHEIRPDGTRAVTKTARVTYRQEWTAYNAAQTHEKERMSELLRGLCDGIQSPQQTKGRPRLPLSDVIFSAVMKVYSTMSGWRAMGELRECTRRGKLDKAPHYNSVFHYLENPRLTPIFKSLVEESANPLRAIETDFAVDSSGFSTSNFVRWYDQKYGRLRSERDWIKAHLIVGVKTNVVTSVEITDGYAHDAPQLAPLVESTAKRFAMSEISADKGYLAKRSLEIIHRAGATPYIPFKTNSLAEGPELWRRMYHCFQFNRTEFFAHYHKRANVETAFSMIKTKFGAAVRARKRAAQINEVLCKVICHNLCILVQSIYELGIEPTFWANSLDALEVS